MSAKKMPKFTREFARKADAVAQRNNINRKHDLNLVVCPSVDGGYKVVRRYGIKQKKAKRRSRRGR